MTKRSSSESCTWYAKRIRHPVAGDSNGKENCSPAATSTDRARHFSVFSAIAAPPAHIPHSTHGSYCK
eukprot:6195341-Pleurochrysis_carterae.AAC.2